MAGKPGAPLAVVTPPSHAPTSDGCARSARCAASTADRFSCSIPAIIWFSRSTVNVICRNKRARFAHRLEKSAAVVRSEVCVAARQVDEMELRICQMWLPAEEHDPLQVAHRALDLRQHPRLARFDQRPVRLPPGIRRTPRRGRRRRADAARGCGRRRDRARRHAARLLPRSAAGAPGSARRAAVPPPAARRVRVTPHALARRFQQRGDSVLSASDLA